MVQVKVLRLGALEVDIVVVGRRLRHGNIGSEWKGQTWLGD